VAQQRDAAAEIRRSREIPRCGQRVTQSVARARNVRKI
jgi:hypothetical protein